jgi:hypothetical protein
VKNDFRKQNKYTCSNISERREGGEREKDKDKERERDMRKETE